MSHNASMRIVHVLWSLGRGGAERFVLDLACEQEKRHEVRVIAVCGGEMEQQFHDADIELTVLGKQPRTFAERFAVVEQCKTLFKQWQPDIVHTHLGADVWAGYFAARPLKIPWVMTAHSHEPDLGFITRMLRFFAYRGTRAVAAVSASVRDMAMWRYGVSEKRVTVIPVGIRLDRFEQRERHQAGDIPKLVVVGRLSPEKGHAVLFEALAQLRRPWFLTIVGDGPMRLMLQRESERLGIAPRLRWAGSVSDPSYFLTTADVFCLPSLHEGQGIALLEAAASRLPAIASDLPAVREVFDRRSMVTVTPGDATALAQAIHQTLTQYTDALDRADIASTIVRKRFGIDTVAEAYDSLYQSL
ncbi:MAG: glycosyltransferase [Patescibacteria group bacterium]